MQKIEIRYLWPSFNDFAMKNFASFIAITLIIARKTATFVFGTMALQLNEALQCSVTYSMKKTNFCLFFYCCNAFIDFIVCDCNFRLNKSTTTVASCKEII